ncbi:MAG: methyltransferase domain-containing protein [Proteobacteria bacterium]|nr:methyltransferase domain-containing protein [Pseudomonadota bacterium]
MVKLYRDSGLDIYEKVHYAHGEHIREVEQILTWYLPRNTKVLDIGCSGGLHALEFARRGFSVVGLDIEPSAIERAESKSRGEMVNVEFRVFDIEHDDMRVLGIFDFIYSIGNVLSHIRKERIYEVFRNIRDCLHERGIFLFDFLMNGQPFQEEFKQDDLRIVWKRKLEEKTGRISMDGIFLDFGITEHFDVWGYSLDEIYGIASRSGFTHIDFSHQLDFSPAGKNLENPVFLNFRARPKEGV